MENSKTVPENWKSAVGRLLRRRGQRGSAEARLELNHLDCFFSESLENSFRKAHFRFFRHPFPTLFTSCFPFYRSDQKVSQASANRVGPTGRTFRPFPVLCDQCISAAVSPQSMADRYFRQLVGVLGILRGIRSFGRPRCRLGNEKEIISARI